MINRPCNPKPILRQTTILSYLVLFFLLGAQLGAQPQLRARDLTFEPTRIDGAVAYTASFTLDHPFSPRQFISAIEDNNRRNTGRNPKLSEIQLIDQGPGWFIALQTFVVRVLIFSDFTHMVLRFTTEWHDDHAIFSWYLEDSPDNKMQWVQGSWTVRPATGSDLSQGPSILDYEVLTIFNRTDYFFEQVLGSFGAGEVRSGVNAVLNSLDPR